MAISDTVQSMKTHIRQAYTAVENKGVTTPESKNLANLAGLINQIPGDVVIPSDLPAPGAYGAVYYYSVVNNTTVLRGVQLATQEHFNAICTNGAGSSTITVNGASFTKSSVVAYRWGSTQITSIPNYFLYNFTSLISMSDMPDSVTTIGNYFMANCQAHNQTLHFSNNLTGIGTYFLAWNYKRAGGVDLSNTKITSIPDRFMQLCTVFNDVLTLPSTVTTIGGYFMTWCYRFNQSLTIPASVTSIGDYFLYDCINLNTEIKILGQIQSIGVYFMANTIRYAQPITITGNNGLIGERFMGGSYMNRREASPITLDGTWSSIGDFFCYGAFYFNSPISITGNDLEIGSSFLCKMWFMNSAVSLNGTIKSIGANSFNNLATFNQPLDLSHVKALGNNCLYGMHGFNQPIDLSSLESIGNYVFYYNDVFDKNIVLPALESYPNNFCAFNMQFNQPLNIPDTVKTVGAYFLAWCYRFNSEITHSIQNFGTFFMNQCTAYTKDFTVPANATIGGGFMYGCTSFSVPYALTIGENPTVTASSNTLATHDALARMYLQGVSITGAGAEAFKEALPDSDVSPYRKLVITDTPVTLSARTTKARAKVGTPSSEYAPVTGIDYPELPEEPEVLEVEPNPDFDLPY